MDPSGTAAERRCGKMLSLWKQEIDDIPLMYEISEISSYLKITTPPLDAFIECMKQYGRTSKTHISPTGFKTELSLNEILDAYREAAGEMR